MYLEYLDWNELIASHFFKSEKVGQPVYLYVTESLINEIGQERGCDFQDFINALKKGVPWVTRHNQGICQKALQSWENWRDNSRYNSDYIYPPYIGYLALFILAAGIEGEGDFAANSYYPRLRYLLEEESKAGQYPSFDQMYQLWEDLEHWANKEIESEWGLFNCITIGQNCHISFPLAQMLLTEEEQKSLPNIFAEADLDPLSIPSETAIANLVAQHGQQDLRSRTLNLLQENEDDEHRQVLIERILEELKYWDGSVDDKDTKSKVYYGSLRLCCKLDEIAGQAKISFRCRSRFEFPEDDLLLLIERKEKTYLCSEDINGWSLSIKLNLTSLDWERGFKMRSQDEEDEKWCFKFSGSSVKILIDGKKNYDLPGWVETSQLPKGQPFYLLVHADHIEAIAAWGSSSCEGFTKDEKKGLPQGWSLFKVDSAKSDNLVKSKYPNLSFPSTIRLSFQGGLRLDRGNRFFAFARPNILLQGHNEEIDIYCQDQKLSPISFGIYQLPEDLFLNQKISIIAHHQDKIVRRINLTLINDNPQNKLSDYTRDIFGHFSELEEVNSTKIRGARVEGFDIPEFNFNTLLPFQSTNRIIFIGRKMGQIATASEIIEQDWSPTWAISLGRRSRVQFCGIDLKTANPIAEKWGDRKQLKKWKELLWVKRKKTTPPKEKKLRTLWKKYQKEAKNV